ncbi:MAG TPA: hypothetical protein VKR06_19390 [Ktedonosporobacter sp.]|nr:hypothetical protein [Ktedonosporobacter sp.]
MQGREGQDSNPWNTPSEQRLNGTSKHPSLNGTSKHPSIASSLQATGRQPAIPPRPPGMTRVSPPPSAPRVARPQRPQAKPGQTRRRLLFFGCLLVACVVLAFVLTYAGIKLSEALSSSNGAATTTTDFLTALHNSNYDQAYKDLGPAITLRSNMSQADFQQQAQTIDRCYGTVQGFSEVADSATNQGDTQSYSYMITRSKLAKPYQIRLTLQLDTDSNTWKITDYGNDLGPGQPAPACSK